MHVAEHVWKRLFESVSKLTEEEKLECEKFIDNLVEIKKEITAAEPLSDRRKELVAKIIDFKNNNRELMDISSPVFWARIRDLKQQRKIVKRNTMTLPLSLN
jgi:hypothetical protein